MTLFEDLTTELLGNERVPVCMDRWLVDEAWTQFPLLVVGTRSFYDLPGRTKFFDEQDKPYRDGELARPYLAHTVREAPGRRGRRPLPCRREHLAMLSLPQPLYFPGGRLEGRLAYVDGTATFWELYRAAGLDVLFDPDPQSPKVSIGRIRFPDAGELMVHRQARNWLVGITRSRTMTVSTFGQVRERESFNPYLTPYLWGLIAHILHAVAVETVVGFGAVYVHTDGWIVPEHCAEALQAHLADEWLLPTKIKGRGLGSVFGCGSYRLPGHESKILASGRPVDNLIRSSVRHRLWLKRVRHNLLESIK